jgi:polysaccharide deacetylase 2 family uncharacterized protein YibQ
MPKAKKPAKRIWGLLILFIFAGLAVYSQLPDHNTPHQQGQAPENKYQVEKTGAGSIADFTTASKKIHESLDKGLRNVDNITISDLKENQREVKRQSVEGLIRWHVRQFLLAVPSSMAVEQVTENVRSAAQSAGGEILAAQADTYQGKPVTRLDIGLKDSLDGEPVTIISDRLYLFTEKVQPPAAKTKEASPAPRAAAGHGTMAIIIDDFGYSGDVIEAFAALNRSITFSVLPYKAHSNEAAARALSSGHQVMLHLPMEPLLASEEQEPTSITVNMGDADIRETVEKALQAVPGVSGVNNHQGSRATADTRVMADVMKVIKTNHLFFIDSRTNSRSIAAETAKQYGVRTADNHLFIDNSSDVNDIKKQLLTAADSARRNGNVIVIGHARPNTAAALKEMLPELEASGITLVSVSQLVR